MDGPPPFTIIIPTNSTTSPSKDPSCVLLVVVSYGGGPSGIPGEHDIEINPKSPSEVILKQICSQFLIEEHYSHFGLYNKESGREVLFPTGVVKQNEALVLRPLPAQKFISRAEVIISKSPHMASKALKHLNDHFIILSYSKLVDTIFVSPFLVETIVGVVVAKPHFVDLLVRLINFPKIRIVLTTAFLGNARKLVQPPSSLPTSPSPLASSAPAGLTHAQVNAQASVPSLAHVFKTAQISAPRSFAEPISPRGSSPRGSSPRTGTSPRSALSQSMEDMGAHRPAIGTNHSASELESQHQHASASVSASAPASRTQSTDDIILPSAPPTHLNAANAAKYARETSLRKLDVFTLMRDVLSNVRLPPPYKDFFKFLISDAMNDGVVARCVLLLNCLLGIAELTVVWGDADDASLIVGSGPSSVEGGNTFNSVEAENATGYKSGVGANRYAGFKQGLHVSGVIEALTKYAMLEKPMPTLRSAISAFQDHLFRPLDMLALGGLDYHKPAHGKLLEKVWWAAFPDTTYPGHLADDWRFLGFHGNPFLTPSQTLISIHALAHFAERHTKVFRETLIEQSELSFRKKGYPLGSLASHISGMLVGFYQFGILRREPRLVKYLFGADPVDLFYRLSDIVLLLMDELWKRAGFTFAQFLPAVRNMRGILQRAHEMDPPDLATLEQLCRQFIHDDYGAPQPVKIVLKRSTFVLEDAIDDEDDELEGEGAEVCPRVYLGSPTGFSANGAEEEVGEDKKQGRLQKFFGEAPEEGLQFAPQPPNVKMMKLKKIFGSTVDTNRTLAVDPDVKEYNKRYRDSLDEVQIKKLEYERAHRLHAFFGEWFDTSNSLAHIKRTRKPSIVQPDITDLVVIRKISIPPPLNSSASASSSPSSDAIPIIHLASSNPLLSSSPSSPMSSSPSSPSSLAPISTYASSPTISSTTSSPTWISTPSNYSPVEYSSSSSTAISNIIAKDSSAPLGLSSSSPPSPALTIKEEPSPNMLKSIVPISIDSASSSPESSPPSSPLSRSPTTTPANAPHVPSPLSLTAKWRPALNRTHSAPLNAQKWRKRSETDPHNTALRPPHFATVRAHNEIMDNSSSGDDSSSYSGDMDGSLAEDDKKKKRFRSFTKLFQRSPDSNRPPSPSSNKRLKRNILKQLFGERINKNLTDLMNEPSIKNEKRASAVVRREQKRPQSPVGSVRVRETTLESDSQALARFRFMNRMKSKSATNIPILATARAGASPPPSPPPQAKRFHTFALPRRAANYPPLQVYPI